MPAVGNISAKPLLPHPPTNQPHGSLPLPITYHPQEERINSLENQGISSSQNSTENQGISNDSLQFLNNNFTMVNPPLKHTSPTKHGNSPLPLLETDHSQRAGINSTKNQGILNDLRNSDRVVGPDTTPAAGNIAAKLLLLHTPTNQPHGSLTLPITNHPKEERIDSLENIGISSSQNSISKQIYIPPGVYNEDKAGDGYYTDGQIGPFLVDMEIEGTQIFEEQ